MVVDVDPAGADRCGPERARDFSPQISGEGAGAGRAESEIIGAGAGSGGADVGVVMVGADELVEERTTSGAGAAMSGAAPAQSGAASHESKIFLTLAQVARATGLSENTIGKYVERLDDPLPCVQRGGNGVAYRFDPDQVKAWFEAQEAKEAAAQRAADERTRQLGLELGVELTRDPAVQPLTQAERAAALRAELDATKIAEMRGRLIDANEARAFIVSAGALASRRLQALADTLQAELDLTDHQVTRINAAIGDGLNDFCDELERYQPEGISGVAGNA